MRRASIAALFILLFCTLAPPVAAAAMEIAASPVQAHVGDVITLTGSIRGVRTIAVYLFVTGPELNNRSVTLENLNIQTGRGLFTTAPVNLADGTWRYRWDTSVILGDLRPGRYTVYAVSTPVDQLRYVREEYATVEVEFLPPDTPPSAVPVPPALAVGAFAIVAVAGNLVRRSCTGTAGRIRE